MPCAPGVDRCQGHPRRRRATRPSCSPIGGPPGPASRCSLAQQWPFDRWVARRAPLGASCAHYNPSADEASQPAYGPVARFPSFGVGRSAARNSRTGIALAATALLVPAPVGGVLSCSASSWRTDPSVSSESPPPHGSFLAKRLANAAAARSAGHCSSACDRDKLRSAIWGAELRDALRPLPPPPLPADRSAKTALPHPPMPAG